METNEVIVDETPVVESAPVVETSAIEEKAVVEETPAEETPAVPEWKPETKFKVRNKEFDFDPEVAKVVTKENQAKLKELYEKAGGLDFAKSRMEQYDAEVAEMKPQIERLSQQTELIERLDKMIQGEDFTSFQKTLNIPDDMVLKRAIEIMKYQELPQDERQKMDAAYKNNERLYNLEQENLGYQQRIQNQAVEAKLNQLDAYLAQPTLISAVQDFESRMGKPGAFREEVIARGQLAYSQRKVDLTPEQAAREVLALAGFNLESLAGNASPASTISAEAASSANIAASAVSKPTLPNIKAGSKTPTGKKTYGSIEEIKAAARAMADNN